MERFQLQPEPGSRGGSGSEWLNPPLEPEPGRVPWISSALVIHPADLDLKRPSLPLKLSDWLPEAASSRLSDGETIDYRRRRWRCGMSEEQKDTAAGAAAQTTARLALLSTNNSYAVLQWDNFHPFSQVQSFFPIFFFLNSSALTRTKTSCPLWQSVFEMCNNLYFTLRLSELNGSSYHVTVPASGSSHYWQSDRNKAGMSKNLSVLVVVSSVRRLDLSSMDTLWSDMFGRSQHWIYMSCFSRWDLDFPGPNLFVTLNSCSFLFLSVMWPLLPICCLLLTLFSFSHYFLIITLFKHVSTMGQNGWKSSLSLSSFVWIICVVLPSPFTSV